MEENNQKKILYSMKRALVDYSTNAKNLKRMTQYIEEAPGETGLTQELMELENNYISQPKILENILNGLDFEHYSRKSKVLSYALKPINTELFKEVTKKVKSLNTVDYMSRVALLEAKEYGNIQKQNKSLVNEVCKTTESYIGSDWEEEIPIIGWKTLYEGPCMRSHGEREYEKESERKSAIEAMKTLRNPDIVKVLKGIDIDKDDFFLSMLRQIIAYHGEAGEIGKTIEQMVKLYTNFTKINREPPYRKRCPSRNIA